eukprot:107976-Rhodomonas_salina.1
MPPPMMSLSHLERSDSITPILDETCSPHSNNDVTTRSPTLNGHVLTPKLPTSSATVESMSEERRGCAHLGATDDGSEGALGLVDGAREVVELLLEEEAGNRRGQELGHTGRGG